jgi:hypothetical protein
LLGLAGLAGLGFSLYRNDVLLNAARGGGWEPRYLAFEARMLGRPGWGTPRSLSAQLQAATPEPAVAGAAALAPVSQLPQPANAPVAAASAAAVTPSASPARSTSDGVAIVSLDALAKLPLEAPRSAPARAAVAPAAPARHVQENAAPARAAPARVAPVAAVAKAPVAAVAKAPVAKAPPRPAAPPVNENPLKAAIRKAIVNESQAK